MILLPVWLKGGLIGLVVFTIQIFAAVLFCILSGVAGTAGEIAAIVFLLPLSYIPVLYHYTGKFSIDAFIIIAYIIYFYLGTVIARFMNKIKNSKNVGK